MYSLKALLDKQPIQITAALDALANLAVVAGWVHLAPATVAAGNTAIVLVLGLFVGAKTVNAARLAELAPGPTAEHFDHAADAPLSPVVADVAVPRKARRRPAGG